jgi:hypothetical protein
MFGIETETRISLAVGQVSESINQSISQSSLRKGDSDKGKQGKQLEW